MRPLRHTLDVVSAVVEFASWAWAIASGRFGEAIEPRRRLAALGVEVSWQPGKARAARESESREGCASAPLATATDETREPATAGLVAGPSKIRRGLGSDVTPPRGRIEPLD
jgi:hypothetical protein